MSTRKVKTQSFSFTLLEPDKVDDRWLEGELEDAFGDDVSVSIKQRVFEDPEDRMECQVHATVTSMHGFDKDEIVDAVDSVDHCDNAQAEGQAFNSMTAEAFNVTSAEQAAKRSKAMD